MKASATLQNIIPIVLNGETIDYLPYFGTREPVWLKLQQSLTTASVQKKQALHKLFFKLLKRIYTGNYSFVTEFETCYKDCVQRVVAHHDFSPMEVEKFVGTAINKAIGSIQNHKLASFRSIPSK
jgi:hypothetical protein